MQCNGRLAQFIAALRPGIVTCLQTQLVFRHVAFQACFQPGTAFKIGPEISQARRIKIKAQRAKLKAQPAFCADLVRPQAQSQIQILNFNPLGSRDQRVGLVIIFRRKIQATIERLAIPGRTRVNRQFHRSRLKPGRIAQLHVEIQLGGQAGLRQGFRQYQTQIQALQRHLSNQMIGIDPALRIGRPVDIALERRSIAQHKRPIRRVQRKSLLRMQFCGRLQLDVLSVTAQRDAGLLH